MAGELDLAEVWALLDGLVADSGALAASAVFLTPHGLVYVSSGPSGHAISVNGERVPVGRS